MDKRELKSKRLYLGLTMEDVANDLKITRQTVSNIERSGKSNNGTLDKYKLYLETKLKELNLPKIEV